MRRLLATAAALLILTAGTAPACFGPKLYLGVPAGVESEALQALVILYVKEKTGTEIVPVPLEGRDPVAEIAGERLDMALIRGEGHDADVLLEVEGLPHLVSGPRPLTDLQFTTVAPALRKLQGLLQPSHVVHLVRRIGEGASALEAARTFLMDRRWI